jgi:DNA-binding YbaB/EbfC family protein
MMALLQQAQQVQQQLADAQQRLAETTVTGSAGGGLVTATVTGTGELTGLTISPEAVDPDDTETLADLVLAAVRDATHSAEELQQQAMGPLASGFGGLPGMPGF